MKFQPYKRNKPWGYELVIADTSLYKGKLLWIEAGKKFSLQYHPCKDETIYCQQGHGRITCGDYLYDMNPGDAERIHPMDTHRVEAITDLVLIEVSTPHTEVVRLEDDYQREGSEE